MYVLSHVYAFRREVSFCVSRAYDLAYVLGKGYFLSE